MFFMFTAAKLRKKGGPVCIQITGFYTSFTDWEGRNKKGLPKSVNL